MGVLMSSAAVLKSLLSNSSKVPVVVPGGGTPLEALAAESAGFNAFYLSGYAVAAWRHGLPDIGLLGARDTAEALTAVTRVCSLPVICDADTGYGNEASVHSTVRLLESAGASAIQFEDQTWPKKCGHMSNKSVVDADEAVRKIAAAVEAKTNPDTTIIARTDSLAPVSIDEAILRAKQFRDAGADVLFIDAPQSIEHLERIGKELAGSVLMANMSESGLTPALSASEFSKLGFGLVVFPTSALRLSMHSVKELYANLKTTGDASEVEAKIILLDELNQLVHLSRYDSIGADAR
jgi:2-methylisocitrate lyase-like PEP mutase family enzyme